MAARQALQRAVEINTNYANAYAGLAFTYVFEALFEHRDTMAPALQQARASAKQAIGIDASVGLANTTLTFVEFVGENYVGDLEMSEKALAVQPGDAYANTYHAYLLAADGQAVISGDDRWAHDPLSRRFRRQEDREMLVRHINELRSRRE